MKLQKIFKIIGVSLLSLTMTTWNIPSSYSALERKVKVSSNDTTAGFLNGKLIQGNGVSFVENNDGGNETLTINADPAELEVTSPSAGEILVYDVADGRFENVPMSGDATIVTNGTVTVADDSHNHIITNIDAFTEAQLESQLSNVSNVFTNNDGALNDDDVTLADVQSATSNDFHNIGGVDDDQPDNDSEVPNNITVAGGNINTSVIVLKTSATPTPTTEGEIQWDTNDDRIAAGNGSGTTVFHSGAHTVDTTLTQEQVEDFAGALINDGTGTHTGISVTYQDSTNDVDFIVDHDAATNFTFTEHFTMLDEDTLSSNSDTQAATQQSIKAYVDSQDHTDHGDGANCSAGNYPLGVDADGAVQDCTADSVGTDTLDDLSDDNIDALADVTHTTISANQLLIRNSGNTAYENKTISGDVSIDASGAATVASTHAGSAHHDAVTMSGTPDYITLSGQDIVRGNVDLAADVTGTLPVGNGGTGAVTLNDLITLSTHTTGNYVASATASEGLTLTGTEAASLGLQDCAANEVLKRNGGDTAWVCAADSTGGAPSFDTIATGTNTTATMTVSTGASLLASGSGTIAATTADALAANGANCTAGNYPLGVDASGAVESCTADVDTTLNASGTQVITGDWDFGSGGIEIENNTTIPGSCTVGQIFMDTDATSGQQLYGCEGGTFVQQAGGGGVTDHGALTGLADDDHSQYPLLLGRGGGQTLIGGTASGDDVTFQTTSDVTKGSYIFSELINCDTIDTNASGVLTCGTDASGAGGTPNILDLGDDGSDESTDLVEIATTGDTNSIFTEPAADKLLIVVGNNWPTSDTADALSANGTNCAAGEASQGIDTAGNAEGCFTPAGGSSEWTDLGTEIHPTEVTDKVLISTTVSQAVGTEVSAFQIAGSAATADSRFSMWHGAPSNIAPQLTLGASRNSTYGSFTIVQANDSLGNYTWTGDDGVDYGTTAARIDVRVDGTPGVNDMPGRMLFMTTPDNSGAVIEAMRIDSSQNVLIGPGTTNISMAANGAAVFNEQGNDADFRIESDTNANLLFVDASTNRMFIGGNSVSAGVSSGQLSIIEPSGLSSLVLENRDAGAGGTQVKFVKASASPASGDELGQMGFQGYDSLGNLDEVVAIIVKESDITSGAEEGSIEYQVMTAGTLSSMFKLGGNLSGGVIWNDGGLDIDYRIEGDTKPGLFFVDASTDKVYIGETSVSAGVSPYKLNIVTDNTQAITIESREAGQGGATLDIYHVSPSPANGDQISTFAFRGYDSTTAFTTYSTIIHASPNITDGSEQGSIDFSVMQNGSLGSALKIEDGITINEAGASQTSALRVEGDTDINLIRVRGDQDRVGIGTGSPTGKFHISGTADQEQLIVRGNSTQTNKLALFEKSDGTDVLTVSNDGLVAFSTTSGITASVTQTQGNGALTTMINEVATVANNNDTVTLPSAATGYKVIIINNGANTLQIFPASGDNLGTGIDTATTLSTGTNVQYVSYDATNWESI